MAAPARRVRNIHFAASHRPKARQALRALQAAYPHASAEKADVVVALGGDGFMLETLHAFMGRDLPIYGMNCGSVGFLMNDYAEENLVERLENAAPAVIRPLQVRGADTRKRPFSALAINEVSLLRETRQTAKIRICVDDRERLPELVADGVLVATPAGSTAYNLSAHGPILPIDARLLALTPISPFRPRGWRGALLQHDARVRFDIIDPEPRPVSAVADNQEFRDVVYVEIAERPDLTLTMLFDDGRALDERILSEQFAH